MDVIAHADGDIGEDLSWEYLSYVRSHPIEWRVPTQILYGSKDHLMPTNLTVPEIKPTSPKAEPKRSLLDEVIAAINEIYHGDFTEGDRVIIGDLLNRLIKDEKLRKIAKNADPQIFKKNQFPAFFAETAQMAYTESQERFTKMFEDKAKYDAIMNAVATILFREFRNTEK